MRAPRSSLALASVVVGAALAAAEPAAAQAFRFLCNGINADGSSDGDGCGACDASTAARWEIGTVPWHYDRTTLPGGGGGVSQSRWASEIASARTSWNNVMGLSLSDGGDADFRQFGVDNGQNEIFWITSTSAWNSQVGGGADSALGVTITQNERCFSSGRAIFDADVVMNGTGFFNWSFNSSESTLAHEMGHGLGLGHPCPFCDELMSATSGGGGSDPLGPQGGDIQGIQQLYPAPGLTGSACTVDSECDSNLCANVGGTRFCSQTCGACPNGMICFNDVVEGNVCVFASSQVAPVGAACDPPGCQDACDFSSIGPGCNFCVPFQDGGQCLAGCNAQTGAGCPAGEECSAIFQDDPVSGVCFQGGTALRGQPCGDTVGCVDGLVCVLETQTTGFCRGLCDNDTAAGCLNTENCLAVFGDNTAACFPAGTATEGDTCATADLSACARGLVCLGTGGATGNCFQRCDQGFQCSDESQDCIALDGLSYCDGGGVIGEGEGEGEGDNVEPPPPPEGQCRIARGNFDCPAGDACELANEDDDIGTCTGEEGDKRTFEICEEDDDCRSGLCVLGVCTRPCDEGDCPSGYECDEDRAPPREPGGDPGLCVPEDCQDDHSICDPNDGFACVFNDLSQYTCAKDGEPVICSHAPGDERGGAAAGLVALVALAWVSRRRRQAPSWVGRASGPS